MGDFFKDIFCPKKYLEYIEYFSLIQLNKQIAIKTWKLKKKYDTAAYYPFLILLEIYVNN